jgi:hypothetical protein
MSIVSRELRQQFQLLEPLKNMAKEAMDEREKCFAELKKLAEARVQRIRDEDFEELKSVPNSDRRGLRTAADFDNYVQRIESDFETSVSGSDARFLMLKDKPNISSGGLRKVTNDSSALLRAERDTIRRVQELKRVAPSVEKHFEDRAMADQHRIDLDHARDQANLKLDAITMERKKIKERIDELKHIEVNQRHEFEILENEREYLGEIFQMNPKDITVEKLCKVMERRFLYEPQTNAGRENIAVRLENNKIWFIYKDLYPLGQVFLQIDANTGKISNREYKRDMRP